MKLLASLASLSAVSAICSAVFYHDESVIYRFFVSGAKLCDVYNATMEHIVKQKPDLQGNFVKNAGYVLVFSHHVL